MSRRKSPKLCLRIFGHEMILHEKRGHVPTWKLKVGAVGMTIYSRAAFSDPDENPGWSWSVDVDGDWLFRCSGDSSTYLEALQFIESRVRSLAAAVGPLAGWSAELPCICYDDGVMPVWEPRCPRHPRSPSPAVP